MIPTTCKRLIEVDFPIAKVSEYSAREKANPSGHPARQHLWWARRPLAACRAVLMGLLLPAPSDQECPADFKSKARVLLRKRHSKPLTTDQELQDDLLTFIAEFADWEHAANALYLEIGRGLVKAAHPEETPVVVDPFSGGGSIPLEALRLGCEAFASDLNPVACLILKTLLEDIPHYRNDEFSLPGKNGKQVAVHGLADALRHLGMQAKESVIKELGKVYPSDPDGGLPIAYLWARTVRCEGIGCGAEIPLVRSFWLARKSKQKQAIRFRVEKVRSSPPEIHFDIFVPTNEKDVPTATVARANALCPCCNVVLPASRVRSQLAACRGGADVLFDAEGNRIGGARLLAVVVTRADQGGRSFRLATKTDYDAIHAAESILSKLSADLVPNEPSPWQHGHRAVASPRIYGMTNWADFFTNRQKVSLAWLARFLRETASDSQTGLALAELMAVALDRLAMSNMTFTRWNAHGEKIQHGFGRQAFPMVWDFAEVQPFADCPGNFESGYALLADVIEATQSAKCGQVRLADAASSPLPDASAGVWFTDPPYWDNVAYADLSDFFFVWLKRVLPNHILLRDPFNPENPLTPKANELTVTTAASELSKPKDGEFFYHGMSAAFREGARVLRGDGVGCVVFAHKTTEGWESLLSGMLKGGFVITASWPITTEMATRMIARDTAALAGSVHLVCRPRPADAGIGDWSEVKAAMEKRVRQWLPTLVKHGIRGADAIFSCLGTALESYSRYDKVLTAADREVPLGGDPDATEPEQRGFLAYVFETLSKEALRQVLGDLPAAPSGSAAQAGADTEGFEEDARLTALFLWTLQTTMGKDEGSKLKAEGEGERLNAKGSRLKEESDEEDEGEDDDYQPSKKTKPGFSMPFDTFIRITRPMGIHYLALEGRVLEIEKGVVRLLSIKERTEELLGDLPTTRQAGAAERPGIEINLEDFRQLELGLVEKKRTEAMLPTKPKKGKKVADPKSEIRNQKSEIGWTTLDRIHRAMLLFGLGRSTLLRQVLETEMRQGKRFERLALSLNALYPYGSDERRMLEGVQAAMRGIK